MNNKNRELISTYKQLIEIRAALKRFEKEYIKNLDPDKQLDWLISELEKAPTESIGRMFLENIINLRKAEGPAITYQFDIIKTLISNCFYYMEKGLEVSEVKDKMLR